MPTHKNSGSKGLTRRGKAPRRRVVCAPKRPVVAHKGAAAKNVDWRSVLTKNLIAEGYSESEAAELVTIASS